MTPTSFNLGKTESYISRPACWIPGGSAACDGFVAITCVKRNGDCDGPHTYGVQRCQLARGRVEVTVWKLPAYDDDRPAAVRAANAVKGVTQRPYRVTVTADGVACNCRSRAGCKHAAAVAELVKRQLI